jgi:[ribosomal protein S18]-alanine N-acetyltransferase
MRRGDAERIAALEQISPSPWPAPLIAGELGRPDGLQLVAVNGDGRTVLGWCCGRYTAPEAELLKIAVLPLQRRCGVGTVLLFRLEDGCRERECDALLLEVRAANTAALGLYQKFGYITIGCRKNYYSDPQDDALILRKSLLEITWPR